MQNVREDREKYIGGSDLPAIMGISPWKTRFRLLQEKAGIVELEEVNNPYVDFGNELEPKIREYINENWHCDFKETKRIVDNMRYHADGDDEEKAMLLEIKTTSQIKGTLKDYQTYLVQLLFGMGLYGYDIGLLAVYERPKDFDTTFNPLLLRVYKVNFYEFADLYSTICREVERFNVDLENIKENPFITEEELQPKELVEIANKVMKLEAEIVAFKQAKAELKDYKARLKSVIEGYNVKSWTTPNGTKITLVPDGEEKLETIFDEKKFKAENPDLWANYSTTKTKKGKAGYVRITQPKQ